MPLQAVLMVGKKPAQLDAFTAGMDVTVRFRIAAAEPHTVYDLTDTPTWAWLVGMRRKITAGTIREVTEKGIVLEDAKDRGALFYRVTDKTRIELSGKAATPGDLKPGQSVHVSPRLLPNGQTMASAIADTAVGAARLRERTVPTVTGAIRAVDIANRTLEMSTRAGDRRLLTIADGCVVRRNGKDVAETQLRAGQWVTAHVRRDDDAEVVRRITIGKRPSQQAGPKPQP
ncbi:MAG: hypothetical protein FJX72_14550 [Armatimonadetes bacterium]|nr:hypothetical protein [Armatimonadota bacterium]